MAFSRYPMVMVHPASTPGMVGYHFGQGKPAMFPPVEVHTEAQEEQYKAKGYVSQGDEASYMDMTSGKPAGYQFHEYPKMVYINGEAFTFKSKEEEDALCGNNDVLEKPAMEDKPRRGRPKKAAA